ncbi:hypothetical protein ACHAW6_015323 [Cyclotella cf. meneghiniana]
MPNNQDDNNNWLSTRRKRKLPHQTTDALSTKQTQQSTGDASIPAAPKSSSSPPSSPSPLPLDWTKLPPCHIKKPRRRIGGATDGAANDIPPLEKVSGRAIFFFPSSNSDIHHPDDDDDDDPTWFQGRFFPDVLAHSPPTLSWGMMGVQTPVVDECLRCSEGGYRGIPSGRSHGDSIRGRENDGEGRGGEDCAVEGGGIDVDGWDMMRLSAAPFVDRDGTGVDFDPTMIVEGTKAVEMAEKYFPSLVGRMREEDNDEFGEEALVVVGDMEMVVPKSFAERRERDGVEGDLLGDDDGLWYD